MVDKSLYLLQTDLPTNSSTISSEHYPVRDFLVSKHPTKSESKYSSFGAFLEDYLTLL